MADRRHTEFSEVLGGQLGQDCLVDRVVPECLLIAFQAEAAQPGTDIHGIHTHTWPHSSTGYRRAKSADTLAVRGRSSRSRTKPSHQNEIASLPHHIGRNTFFWLVERGPESAGANPERASENGAQPHDPPTLLALAHETDHPVSLAARLRRILFLENIE